MLTFLCCAVAPSSSRSSSMGSNEGWDLAEDPQPGKVVQEQVLAFVHQVLDDLEGCQVALIIILEKNEEEQYINTKKWDN